MITQYGIELVKISTIRDGVVQNRRLDGVAQEPEHEDAKRADQGCRELSKSDG
jgi:hypothetical protein